MPERPPSLEPMRKGLERVFSSPSKMNPQKIIVVAGTNGKGSVCATLEALFLATGETVGLFTSPHLIETTERIRINGKDISPELFCEVYHAVRQAVLEMTPLSHFEMLTLMAAWVFLSGEKIPPVDRPIFEVGLGGTWDATNAIPHLNCVITSLGLDHQNLLGYSLPEIALNKFGIVTLGANVVHSVLPVEVQPLSREVQRATQSRWTESFPMNWKVTQEKHGPQFHIQTPWGEAPIQLAGPRAIQNSATALTLFHSMGYSPGPYLASLSQVRWPGRMEKYETPISPCPIYLSGDHNPEGIASLIDLLEHYPRKHLYILLGVVKDKDLDPIISPLLSLPNSSLFITEVSFRKRTLKEYGKWLPFTKGGWSNPPVALEKIAERAMEHDLILVTGSLYLVGEIQAFLKPTARC